MGTRNNTNNNCGDNGEQLHSNMLIGGAGAMGQAYLESLNENGEIQIGPDGT